MDFFKLAVANLGAEKTCTMCGGVMTLTDGEVSRLIAPGYNATGKMPDYTMKPGFFWACNGCENCEEVRPNPRR